MKTIWKWLTNPNPPTAWEFMAPIVLLALFFVVMAFLRFTS